MTTHTEMITPVAAVWEAIDPIATRYGVTSADRIAIAQLAVDAITKLRPAGLPQRFQSFGDVDPDHELLWLHKLLDESEALHRELAVSA